MEQIPVTYLWLIAGAFFVALEAFGVSGIGFLFAGLAALTTAILIQANTIGIEAYFAQFAWFFGLTAVWGAVLWKPLRKFHKGKPSAYNNMIGEIAIVAETGLHMGVPGLARWSGTIMQAELTSTSIATSLPPGSRVKIIDVKGATLIVEPSA